MKAALTGLAGVGKSAVGDILVARYGLKKMSAGDFYRDMAKSMNLTLLELEALAEKDPSIDYEVDRRTTEYGKEHDNFIFDGRLAAECIPDAVKILLTCVDDARFHRIAMARNKTFEEARYETLTREKSIRDRFKRYYSIDRFDDPARFDLVIDTTAMPLPIVIQQIENHLRGRGLLAGRILVTR